MIEIVHNAPPYNFLPGFESKKTNKNNSRLSRSRCVRLFKRPIERNHLVKYDFKIISLKQQIASTFATMMSAAFDFFFLDLNIRTFYPK